MDNFMVFLSEDVEIKKDGNVLFNEVIYAKTELFILYKVIFENSIFENTLAKGIIAHNEQFLLLPEYLKYLSI